MNKKVMEDKTLSIESKGIFAYLFSLSDTNLTCCVRMNKILRDLCISEKRFYKYRKELINNGYLRIQENFDKDGRRLENIYILKD